MDSSRNQIEYDPRFDGEQLSVLDEHLVVTDDAILPDDVVGDGELVRASNAAYGVRVIQGQHPVLDVEIFASPLGYGGMEVYPLDGRNRPVTIEMPFRDYSDCALKGAVRAVMVARALGQVES